MLFISSKKLFSFLRYSVFSNFTFPSFFPVGHCFRAWSKINLKVYDVISFLNKNLKTHFVRYLEKEKRYDIKTSWIDKILNKEYFYKEIIQKMYLKSLSWTLLILVNNPKQPVHARHSFEIIWKSIIKKP